jgi:SAM-dependent methyltransferase
MSLRPIKKRLGHWLETKLPFGYMTALVALNVKDGLTRPAIGSAEVERHSTQGFVESIERYFADYLANAGLRPEDLPGLSVLEIGSGDSYGVALKFIQHGARRVVCTDRFESARSVAGEAKVYRQMFEAVQSEAERSRLANTLTFTVDGFVLDESRIQTLIAPAEQLPQYLGGEQFDLIVSRAVLEHVFDLDGVFQSMTALLRPGARTVHCVDLANHGMFAAHGPAYFLRFPDWLWRLASSHRGLPNRRRKSHFVKLIAKSGLTLDQMIDVVRLSPEHVREARAYLHESQISDEDVAVQQIFFTARKAAS